MIIVYIKLNIYKRFLWKRTSFIITHLLNIISFNFFIIINNYLAYFIIIVIDLIRFKYFMIKKIIDNIDVELDVIEIQLIRYENDLILLFQSFIIKINKFVFNYTNESINFEIL